VLLRQRFGRFDVDKDGVLNRDEVRSMMQQLGFDGESSPTVQSAH
jgi:Ca2+-binding EF-hand superfamily protein